MAEGRILTDKDLKSISSDIGKKADKSHTHTCEEIAIPTFDFTGDNRNLDNFLFNLYTDVLDRPEFDDLNKKINFIGQNPAKNIQIISSGGSTSSIPKETLIFELE